MPTGSGGSGARSKATTKGRIHDVYAGRLEDLRTQAEAQYEAFRMERPRPWQHPSDSPGDQLSLFSISIPFDRTQLNTNYMECTANPDRAGTVADLIAIKLQIDYVAAEERAYRQRHSTLARSMAHSIGRRFGQGRGPLFERIRKEAEDLIRSGGARPAANG